MARISETTEPAALQLEEASMDFTSRLMKGYEHDTADATHRQYHPDFFLPDANAYLEHWAVDDNGNPPPSFTDYRKGMDWKRALHAQHGTRLLETTMAELWSGKRF